MSGCSCVSWFTEKPSTNSNGQSYLPYLSKWEHLVHLIQQQRKANSATVLFSNTQADTFSATAELRQGCILSQLLFIIYIIYIIRETWDGGIALGGRKISNLRYADETLIIAKDEEELENILEALDE